MFPPGVKPGSNPGFGLRHSIRNSGGFNIGNINFSKSGNIQLTRMAVVVPTWTLQWKGHLCFPPRLIRMQRKTPASTLWRRNLPQKHMTIKKRRATATTATIVAWRTSTPRTTGTIRCSCCLKIMQSAPLSTKWCSTCSDSSSKKASTLPTISTNQYKRSY